MRVCQEKRSIKVTEQKKKFREEILHTMKEQNRINLNLTLAIENFAELLTPELKKTDSLQRVEEKRKAFQEKYKDCFDALEGK